MFTIPSDKVVYSMSSKHPPVLAVPDGSEVTFETCDCFQNQIQVASDQLSGIDWNHINPATGPLFVEGAMPGDVLKVSILKIEVADQGVMTPLPGEGALGDFLTEEITRIIPIRDNKAYFTDSLLFDISPMIGVIGTAPSQGEDISTGTPDAHGGNMDTKRIVEGSVLYLPVHVEGALLSMGDLHALMADGEVLFCGLETAGRVHVRVDVIKGEELPLPLLVEGEDVITIASSELLDDAALDATHQMMRLMLKHTTLSSEEAGMLMSLKGELRISQIVDPKKTARMEFPLALLKKYGFRLP